MRGVVVPLDGLDVRPALALRRGDEVLPQRLRHDGAAPQQLVALAVPRVRVVCPRATGFHLSRFALHLDVAADFGLLPAPEAVVRQQPDEALVGAARVGPRCVRRVLVIRDEGELEVWGGGRAW